jgi:hypothetical protein
MRNGVMPGLNWQKIEPKDSLEFFTRNANPSGLTDPLKVMAAANGEQREA